MKTFFLLFLLALSNLLPAQDFEQSKAELFSKAPGAVIESTELFNERFSGIIGSSASVSLVRLNNLVNKESLLALKFYGKIIHIYSSDLSIVEEYSALLDYDDLEKLIQWMDIVKGYRIPSGGNPVNNRITYNTVHGKLAFSLRGDTFEFQADRFDENGIVRLRISQLDILHMQLEQIRQIWNRETGK